MLFTTHIYIDESACDTTNTATLTVLIIPSYKLKRIEQLYYKIVEKVLKKFPSKNRKSRIIYNPISFHGNNFLQNSKENKSYDFSVIDDEFRIEIMSDLINIVVSNKIQIIRLGYNNLKEMRKTCFKKDQKLHGINWVSLSRYIDSNKDIKNALCIMDGQNMSMIQKLSSFIHGSKHYSYVYSDMELIINNGKKFIGNVYYVPSKYCEYLQLVDIISYVLHKNDLKSSQSAFGKKIKALNKLFDEKKLLNCVTNMKNID